MVNIDKNTFPLTHRFRNVIGGFSVSARLPLGDCFQESYILEWELRTRQFKEREHRINYFRKAVHKRLVNFLYRERHRKHWTESDALALYGAQVREGQSFFDYFLVLRPFEEFYAEAFIMHVYGILKELDEIAAQIFAYRLETEDSWRSIHRRRFDMLTRHQFYQKVNVIKDVTLCELEAQRN